jgi:hypothetical protein
MSLSRGPDETAYAPTELAMLQEAYERACLKLGIKISANEDDNTPTRIRLAKAIMDAAGAGERDVVNLSIYAVVMSCASRARLPAPRLASVP